MFEDSRRTATSIAMSGVIIRHQIKQPVHFVKIMFQEFRTDWTSKRSFWALVFRTPTSTKFCPKKLSIDKQISGIFQAASHCVITILLAQITHLYINLHGTLTVLEEHTTNIFMFLSLHSSSILSTTIRSRFSNEFDTHSSTPTNRIEAFYHRLRSRRRSCFL